MLRLASAGDQTTARPRHQALLDCAGEDQDEGESDEHLGNGVCEEEVGDVHVVRHVAELRQGKQGKAPPEAAVAVLEGAHGEVRPGQEKGDVHDEEERPGQVADDDVDGVVEDLKGACENYGSNDRRSPF